MICFIAIIIQYNNARNYYNNTIYFYKKYKEGPVD